MPIMVYMNVGASLRNCTSKSDVEEVEVDEGGGLGHGWSNIMISIHPKLVFQSVRDEK